MRLLSLSFLAILILGCGKDRVKFTEPAALVIVDIPPVAGEPIDQTATLTWDANTEEDLAGYKVYHSIVPDNFSVEPPITIGKITTYKFTNLAKGTTHYFTVTAYDNDGNESGYAIQVSKFIGTRP